MTATATRVSNKSVISEKEWVKLFPRQVTENATSSLAFIKQMTLVAVSTITYLKNAFPEECYSTEMFAGLPLRLLNLRCSDDLAQFVSTALHQAWEAFDKKYIQQLALCFYENDAQPHNLVEYHAFTYSYTDEGVTLNVNSKNRGSDFEKRSLKFSYENVKERTAMWIRMLYMYLTQNGLQELPVNYDISLRLYYSDDAPEGYQAPGFLSNNEPDHLEPTVHEAQKLAWVETPFHKMAAWTYVRGMFPASDEAEPSANPPAMTQDDYQDMEGFKSSITETSEGSSDIQLHCPCNRCDLPAEPAELITCQYCFKQQHAVCFGFFRVAPREHCCAACYDAEPRRRPSDAKLVALNYKRRECLCLYRRTLALCSHVATIDGQMLVEKFAINESSACKMIKLLKAHNVIPNTSDDDDLTVPRKINLIRLKLAFKRFFYPEENEEDTVVDRLMAETEAAQDTSDPIGDVLSPIEKITLHNTSNLGQVIETPENITKRNSSVDKILQEYREAVTINNDIDEELPLSGSHNPVKNVEKIGKKKSLKRKTNEEDWLPKLRSGSKTKKARNTSY